MVMASFSGSPYPPGDSESGPDFRKQEDLKSFQDTPVFVFHGERDNICRIEDVKQIASKLQENGAIVEVHIEPERGHANPEMTRLAVTAVGCQ